MICIKIIVETVELFERKFSGVYSQLSQPNRTRLLVFVFFEYR